MNLTRRSFLSGVLAIPMLWGLRSIPIEAPKRKVVFTADLFTDFFMTQGPLFASDGGIVNEAQKRTYFFEHLLGKS